MGKVVPLTVQNAQIKTAAVDLKVLTVTGKQVTLAVFRQLIEEPLISQDGGLLGLPWGHVNYHPGLCSFNGYECKRPHWHIVWQLGSELRRSTIPVEIHFDVFRPPAGYGYATAYLRDVLMGDIADKGNGLWKATISRDFSYITGSVDGVEFHCSASNDIGSLNGILCELERKRKSLKDEQEKLCSLRSKAQGREHERRFPDMPYQTATWATHIKNVEERVEIIQADIHQLQEQVDDSLRDLVDFDLEQMEAGFLQALREEYQRRQRWDKTLQELASLPQLFIAI